MCVGKYNWMKKCDTKASAGANNAMKATKKLVMKMAGSK